jgi:transposase
MPVRKYDPETRERAVRLFRDRRRDKPTESVSETLRQIGTLVDVPVDTLRGWAQKHEVDAGERPGVPSDVHARIKELERENAELRRANEILKTASAFFAAAELDRRFR